MVTKKNSLGITKKGDYILRKRRLVLTIKRQLRYKTAYPLNRLSFVHDIQFSYLSKWLCHQDIAVLGQF